LQAAEFQPTANPKRRNITAPSRVEIAVKKTGAVPNFRLLMLMAFQKNKIGGKGQLQAWKIQKLLYF